MSLLSLPMNQDLRQYANIIEALKPVISKSGFNNRLNELTEHLPKERRFLIKMEMQRLARPCMRSIDLRGQVNGECRLYEYNGIQHYLDDVAIETFEDQLSVFGQFTFGVYEAVMETDNNFKVMREREEQQRETVSQKRNQPQAMALEKYTVPVVNLLSYARRHQERMNFAVSIEVFAQDGSVWRGNSVDISTEGLQIKLGKETSLQVSDQIEIFFRGLEEEFAMDKKQGVVYRILKMVYKNEHQYLMLQRAENVPNVPFDQFLQNFIRGNKRRYKVNMSNTIDAVYNKIAEQFLSPRSPSLPVFIDQVENKLIPRFAMLNEINTDITDYWSDEQRQLRLGYLLSASRLQWLVNRPAAQRELYVYAFTHLQQDKIYFYSASSKELDAKEVIKTAFLGFGARKVSWRVFKLVMSEMSPDQAHAPLSLPDNVSDKIKRLNQEPSARLMARLKNLRHVVHITDVTSDSGQEYYSQYKFNRANLPHLRVFGHARNRPPAAIQTYRYRFHDKRMEKRYLVRTTIALTASDGGTVYKGVSEDISVRGLRVELNQPFNSENGAPVEVAFPKLQSLTDKYDLMHLQYRIVASNGEKNIVHLKAVEGEQGAVARKFFEDLIKKNKSSLKTYQEEEDLPGIGHALRCINAKNTPNLAFTMNKEGARYLPQAAIDARHDERINQIAAHYAPADNLNFEFMFRDRNLESPFIQHGIKQIKLEQLPLRQELFVAFDPDQKLSRMAILPRFDNRFSSHESREKFIHEAIGRGQFIALHVLLTTTGKPDMEMLQAEMNYVSMYAIHRARELEEFMWDIVACAHLVDVTDEVLSRYNIEPALIRKNRRHHHQSIRNNAIRSDSQLLS
ncbi:PilZ domain-containing protein [Salinimonas chungwhensis]|uniref:PilZ domain-containing protein n=1 Tax=Salinimonas chungwhensis TaxID=265425 RepID=UPI0012EA7922|nr:PilZ domain-containing protein [Salinimonas chungwhensis]